MEEQTHSPPLFAMSVWLITLSELDKKKKKRRIDCRAARKKDYQPLECLGMCVRPGCAIPQNKIPVIEMLLITETMETEEDRKRR